MVEAIKAVILGVVEGITEWLPISSTGHMILVDEFLQLDTSDEFKEMFFVVIQLGAILAVCFLYFNKLNPFALSKTKEEKKETWNIWGKVIVGCLPAALIGIPLNDWIDKVFYNWKVVATMLIVYGILFIIVENYVEFRRAKVRDFSELTYKLAIAIGIFQVLALIPGTSRSGATILGAVLLGCSRFVAAEYSFFLSIPVMFGASMIKIIKFGFVFAKRELFILGIGCLVAFIVSIIAIKFLMSYIKKNDFRAFGVYRIIIGAFVIIYFLFFN
ncbi:MAG: undecaprenyl-diphosphate phosphatase [Lachnospiraceae bacterium]